MSESEMSRHAQRPLVSRPLCDSRNRTVNLPWELHLTESISTGSMPNWTDHPSIQIDDLSTTSFRCLAPRFTLNLTQFLRVESAAWTQSDSQFCEFTTENVRKWDREATGRSSGVPVPCTCHYSVFCVSQGTWSSWQRTREIWARYFARRGRRWGIFQTFRWRESRKIAVSDKDVFFFFCFCLCTFP